MPSDLSYFSLGQRITLENTTVADAKKLLPKPIGATPATAAHMAPAPLAAFLTPMAGLMRADARLVDNSPPRLARRKGARSVLLLTHTLIVENPRKPDLAWLRSKFGLAVVREAGQGRLLLAAPDGGDKGIETVFEAARAFHARSPDRACHPNFVRILRHPLAPPDAPSDAWNLNNDGTVGQAGADVHANAAWTISRGDPAIRVAVLDEGVDNRHPALKKAIVAQKDFSQNHSSARPSPNDTHGTKCAGVIASRSQIHQGLAPEVSLVAVRIARGDGANGWIFDDFQTANAIDWSWNEGKADVLSNSWGGGPPVDAITNAFERARTKGRQGKGCVIAIASGNDDGRVSFPATLPNVLCVGASNQWDERKSKKSKDGENWWGSNYGSELDLVAPGVKIWTTTISSRPAEPEPYVPDFNGTSSATPHVAAVAALILSVAPKLTERRVREILLAGADPLTKNGKPDKYTGHGRLNAYASLRLAAAG
jgi:thermitase